MKDLTEKLTKYLSQAELMQVATNNDGKPWVCTVHFVEDDDLNLYWLSLPSRRHSEDVERNPNVAVAVVIKPSKPVIGVQAEGQAKEVQDLETVERMMKKYVTKYGIGGKFYDNVVAGINKHRLYKFSPENFVLFDEMSFKENSRKEWQHKK